MKYNWIKNYKLYCKGNVFEKPFNEFVKFIKVAMDGKTSNEKHLADYNQYNNTNYTIEDWNTVYYSDELGRYKGSK